MWLLKVLSRCSWSNICISPQRISTTTGFQLALLTGAGNCMVAAAPAQAGAAPPPECTKEIFQKIQSRLSQKTQHFLLTSIQIAHVPVGMLGGMLGGMFDGMFGGIQGGIGGPPGAFTVSPTHLKFNQVSYFKNQGLL